MAHLIFEFQPPNFVKSHNFCRQITEKSLVIISESVSDLEKSGGSALSICIDVLGLLENRENFTKLNIQLQCIIFSLKVEIQGPYYGSIFVFATTFEKGISFHKKRRKEKYY